MYVRVWPLGIYFLFAAKQTINVYILCEFSWTFSWGAWTIIAAKQNIIYVYFLLQVGKFQKRWILFEDCAW
jgi:hypothetical protein